MMQAAARLSGDEGFSGRVGLHSLPQSRPFYTSVCEMQALGPDPSYHHLEYFELTAAKDQTNTRRLKLRSPIHRKAAQNPRSTG